MQRYVRDRFQAEANICNLCFAQYDRRAKKPLIICSIQHTICTECMRRIESNPKCPYCREAIDFRRIVLNKLIFGLLPREIPAGAQMQGLPKDGFAQQSRIQDQMRLRTNVRRQNNLNRIPRRSSSPQPLPLKEHSFIHSRPSKPILSQPSLNNTRNNDQLLLGNQNIVISQQKKKQQQLQAQRAFQFHRQGVLQVDWPFYVLYGLIVLSQLPFIIIDFCIVFLSPYSECLDVPHEDQSVMGLRAKLLMYAVFSVILMTILILSTIMQSCRDCQDRECRSIQKIVALIYAAKIIIWAFFEIVLIETTFVPYCSGGILTYGILLAVFNSLLVPGTLILISLKLGRFL